jgi:hypothetical protein
MNRKLTVTFVFLLLGLLLPAGLLAYKLSPEDLELLERAESPYKVSPEMESKVQALTAPFEMDAVLPGGFVLEGIQIDRHFARLILKSGDLESSLYLLPPVVEADGAIGTPSFQLLPEGALAAESTAALIAAVVKNDDGTFWPDPAVQDEAAGRRVPVVARKLHVTELIGDFFVVLLLIALFVGLPGFRGVFVGRSLTWWWALLGIVAYAFAVRLIAAYSLHGDDPSVIWSPSSELPHSSVAWFLNTLGRFLVVGTGTVAAINLVIATLTVVGVYLLVTLLVPGIWPAIVAGLLVASAPMHVALSGTITVMIPFVGLLTAAALAGVTYTSTGDGRVHWLGATFFLFAVFARPEALVLTLPVLALVPILASREQLRRVDCWGPLLAQVVVLAVRGATIGMGPEQVDPFLSWQVDWGTLHSNVGNWLIGFGRVSFAAMLFWAMGIAARPWKSERALSVVMAAWLLLGIAVYFHVDMTASFQGGRVALYFLLPLAWLAAHGARFLVGLKHTQRWWLLVLLLMWLLFTPLIHRSAVDRDFKATYRHNFLIEA